MSNDPTPTQLQNTIRVVGVVAEVEKASAPATIGQLWARAGQEGVITGGKPTYGVYFDYQDQTAEKYKVLVGQQSDAPVAPGQTEVTLPAGQYAQYQDEGAVPAIVEQAWMHVWTKWQQRAQRTFRVDFERYVGPPAHSKFDLFIGVDGN